MPRSFAAAALRVIDARDLVPEDIIELQAGYHMPADGRVIEGTDLRTNEAALTGESLGSTTVVCTDKTRTLTAVGEVPSASWPALDAMTHPTVGNDRLYLGSTGIAVAHDRSTCRVGIAARSERASWGQSCSR